MPPKIIKLAKLNQMAAEGADIMRQPREVVVDGLQEMVAQLGAHDDSALIDILEQLIIVIDKKETSVKVEAVDFKPLIAILTPKPYRFEIERNQRGQMTSVLAVPEVL